MWAQVASRELQLADALQRAFAQPKQIGVAGDDNAFLARFCDSDAPFDILATPSAIPASDEEWALSYKFPAAQAQPSKIPLGQRRVVLVVAASSPVDELQAARIRGLLGSAANGKSWKDLVGKGPAGHIRCFAPAPNSAAMEVLSKTCLEYWEHDAPNVLHLRTDDLRADARVCDTPRAVLDGVRAAGPAGLGIADLPAALSANWTGLKPLAIRVDADTAVKPVIAPVIQVDYPLAETITLYVHPNAIERSKEFIAFCLSRDAGQVISKHGLISAWDDRQEVSKNRLADYNAGKGTPVAVCGLAGREDVVKALAIEYVKAKALVQVKYERRATVEEAERAFGEAGELLVEEGGEQNAEGGGQKAEGGNTIHPLGHRAVGVIVHRDSAAKELTLDDLRQIYSGQIDAWPGASRKDAKMKLIGLPTDSPAMGLVDEKIGTGARHARITRRDDTAKVVQAVGNELGAVGFVDLAAMPAKESSVKLLAILADGAKKTAAPSPDTVPEGYPLAQPVTLSVHAKASAVAKDFAAFIAAHGPEVQEALQASGIVPAAPPKAESGGQRAEGGGENATALGSVLLGQFDEDESGGEMAEGGARKEEKAALTPGPSPATGRGEQEILPSGPSPEGQGEQKAERPAQVEPGAREHKVPKPADSPPSDAQAAADPRLVLGAVLVAAAAAAGFFALRLARR